MKALSVKHLLDLRSEPEWNDWRWQMRNRIVSSRQIYELFPELMSHARFRPDFGASSSFSFAVTPYYLSLADLSDPDCPILMQAFPDPVEERDERFHRQDPLEEESHMPRPGLTHRYPDRVLWYLSHNCAVYCRFCMRKRKVGEAQSVSGEWDEIFSYIASNRDIKEVILSGGDPLSLSDEKIEEVLSRLRRMEHLYSIRIHTRMPVTLPVRITQGLCNVLARNYPLTVVTHFNHAREITAEAAASIRMLRMSGTLVLNQSVLLAGINDSAEKMEKLLLRLVRCGVKPYYLHRCDEVRGVSHFRAPVAKGLEILRALRGRNPGIALPRYVVDLPGGGGKVPLDIEYEIAASPRIPDGSPRRLFKNWAEEIFEILD